MLQFKMTSFTGHIQSSMWFSSAINAHRVIGTDEDDFSCTMESNSK